MEDRFSVDKLFERLVQEGHLPRDANVQVKVVQRDEMEKRLLVLDDDQQKQNHLYPYLLNHASIKVSGMAVRHAISEAIRKYTEDSKDVHEYYNLCMMTSSYIDAMVDDQYAAGLMKNEAAKENAAIEAIYKKERRKLLVIRVIVGIMVTVFVGIILWGSVTNMLNKDFTVQKFHYKILP